MTEERNSPDDAEATVRRLATQSVERLNHIVTAMMVDAVDQVQKSPDTWRHEEVSLTMRDLAGEALAVPYIHPQDVVFATARAAAAIIVPLCKPLGIDPAELVQDIEERVFRSSL